MSAGATTFKNSDDLRIDAVRLMDRIMSLADISPIAGGGNCRLALTDDDKDGRDLVVSWMRDLNMDVSIDAVGNIIAIWNVGTGAPVMTGSHIDTVRTGGKFDGNSGVLAGLQVVETCQKNGFTPSRPLAVVVDLDLAMNLYESVMRDRHHAPESFPTLLWSCISSKVRFLRRTMFASEQLPECRVFHGKR